MAYVTRAIRAQMRADAAERQHPEWAAQRVFRRAVAEWAGAERARVYPRLTAENVDEAIAFQAFLIDEAERELERS